MDKMQPTDSIQCSGYCKYKTVQKLVVVLCNYSAITVQYSVVAHQLK